MTRVRSTKYGVRSIAAAIAVCLGLGLGSGVVPALAADDPLSGDTITITGTDSGIEFKGRRYAGRMEVRSFGDRVVLVEYVDVDTYLRGIREVPASWHPEALKAQVVAARTYLAWTLQRGRVGLGADYGYDICATSACQVYRGGLGEEGAGPWDDAVAVTAKEILLYEGSPAQALYSSTTGGRTRNVEDIFGSTPKPYLRAVDSPGEQSPYVSWRLELTRDDMQSIFDEAGISGVLLSLTSEKTDDGGGPWLIHGLFSDRYRTWTTWQFRGVMNKYGPRALPERLPWRRADGRRVPQTILGPSYGVAREYRFVETDVRVRPFVEYFVFQGGGWGHDVGMSQYGARAMADAGSDYGEILGHYYSGLVPEPAGSFLPEELIVGLAVTSEPITVGGVHGLTVTLDGIPLADGVAGEWVFDSVGGVLQLIPPWERFERVGLNRPWS